MKILSTISSYWFLGVAAIPFIYYLIVIVSSWRYFSAARRPVAKAVEFTPPVSILKPMVGEARHEVVVISDSDVRVRPDYLREVTAPLARQDVGAVTCFYVPAEEKS